MSLKNPAKFPPNFPQNFSAKNQEISPTSFCRRKDFLSAGLRKRKKISGVLFFFVTVACCCGLCEPNMLITKASAKENLGEIICLSIVKAKANQNPQIFICNCFRADGTTFHQTRPRMTQRHLPQRAFPAPIHVL